MTTRQQFLKLIYPLFIRFTRIVKGKKTILSKINYSNTPNQSFYSLQAVLADGASFDFATLKGKKVLVVNVASDCGYTPQYSELEKLNQLNKPNLVILGFPANDFKEQEPGGNIDIGAFCQKNYSVSFPLFQKHSVIGNGTHEVFQWLSDKSKNGWNDQQPIWNFCKYLVDENGILQHFFPPYISPLSNDIIRAVKVSP